MDIRLIKWMIVNIDGDWEHENGVRISSQDNPGWGVEIDLSNTPLEDVAFDYECTEEHKWITAKVENYIFYSYCSLNAFNDVMEIFFEKLFKPQIETTSFEYEIFVQILTLNGLLWRPVYGNLTSDLNIKITRIPEFNVKDLKAESIDVLANTSLVELDSEIGINEGEVHEVHLKKFHDGHYPAVYYRP